MDRSLYTAHAELEERHWWFLAKNHLVLHVAEAFLARAHARSRAGVDQRRGDAPPSDASRARVLDAGCGTGGLLALLSRRHEALGVELDAQSREHCLARGLRVVDGRLPGEMPTGPFDLIIASEVLEHVQEDRASAEVLARMLAPGGVLVCTVPAHPWLWSKHDELNHHHRRYTLASFRGLWRGLGLRERRASYCLSLLFPLRVLGHVLERGESDRRAMYLRTPGPVANAALRWAFECEKWILPWIPLPMGSSIITVHEKPRDGATAPK